MEQIKYYADVTVYQMRQALLVLFEYPANFIGWLLSNPLQFVMGFATLKFVVQEFGTINGWNYGQLACLYGIAVMSHALSMIFFVQGWFMGYYVIEGEFDRFLLRPLMPIRETICLVGIPTSSPMMYMRARCVCTRC